MPELAETCAFPPRGHRAGAALSTAADPAMPSPARPANRWAALASMAISLALLVAVALQFRDLDTREIARLVPSSPLFWTAFAGYYLALPISEWVIYRRLWQFPPAGFGALLRKLVSNELLLGYLGEAQFYAWARARGTVNAAPFAAIKDITILSALTGNLATLVMLALAWPYVTAGQLGVQGQSAFAALGIVLVTSLAILLFRQKLFTLPRRELLIISAIHLARIAAVLILSAVMWHAVLPQVALTLWLVLATLRQLISRLPLMPNKDVVFAGITVLLLGNSTQVAALMAMMAVLLLAAHLLVGTIFGLAGLFDTEKTK